jgi:hypothetical protein
MTEIKTICLNQPTRFCSDYKPQHFEKKILTNEMIQEEFRIQSESWEKYGFRNYDNCSKKNGCNNENCDLVRSDPEKFIQQLYSLVSEKFLPANFPLANFSDEKEGSPVNLCLSYVGILAIRAMRLCHESKNYQQFSCRPYYFGDTLNDQIKKIWSTTVCPMWYHNKSNVRVCDKSCDLLHGTNEEAKKCWAIIKTPSFQKWFLEEGRNLPHQLSASEEKKFLQETVDNVVDIGGSVDISCYESLLKKEYKLSTLYSFSRKSRRKWRARTLVE